MYIYEKEFNEFMSFIKSFKDGDHFTFHFYSDDAIQNISIYRVGKKLKYSADYRFKEGGHWFLTDEQEGVFGDSTIGWLEFIFDAPHMRQGWCNVDCDFQL